MPPSHKNNLKVLGWVLVALYTFILPYVFIAYTFILENFGKDMAGKVPVFMVAAAGIIYVMVVLLSRKNPKNLLFLVPCAIIAFLIMTLVSNPNKHIHIPEYILMTWLLFAVLSRDHKGKGIFILIFIYASLLGVVDELEQGIHPTRFYGLSDMVVNSASAMVGVFTLMGLKKVQETDWGWIKQLREFKSLLWLSLFGLAGAVLMCKYLFQVQASQDFWGVYPQWLWIWNILFLILTPVMIVLYRSNLRKHYPAIKSKKAYTLPPKVKTAHLWIFPLLAILYYMQLLVVYGSISGVKFI